MRPPTDWEVEPEAGLQTSSAASDMKHKVSNSNEADVDIFRSLSNKTCLVLLNNLTDIKLLHYFIFAAVELGCDAY